MSSISRNPELKAELINRWLELDVYSINGTQQRHKEIIADATERAPWMKITSDRLSKWLNGDHKYLSDKQVLFLAKRYGIDVDNTVTIEVKKYNEQECLRRIKAEFPMPEDYGKKKKKKIK